jgi:predicted nucleic acid-binding Zn ribbon protein
MSEELAHDPAGTELALQIAAGLGSGAPPAIIKTKRAVPRSSRSQSDLDSAATVIDKLVIERGWQKEFGVRQMTSHWSALVGETNAAHSFPEAFDDGILVVRTESSTWASAFRSIANQVVARLNTQLGEGTVTRIDVRGPAVPKYTSGRLRVKGPGPRDTWG